MTQGLYGAGKTGIVILKHASDQVKQFDQGHLESGEIEMQIQAFWFQIFGFILIC